MTVYVLLEYTIHFGGETNVIGVVDSEEKAEKFANNRDGLACGWSRSYEKHEVE